MPTDILLITALRGLVEVAGIMLIVRGLLWLFGPRARRGNFVYDILTIGTLPFIRLARKLSPRALPDETMPVLAFFLLVSLWIALGFVKAALCDWRGLECV